MRVRLSRAPNVRAHRRCLRRASDAASAGCSECSTACPFGSRITSQGQNHYSRSKTMTCSKDVPLASTPDTVAVKTVPSLDTS